MPFDGPHGPQPCLSLLALSRTLDEQALLPLLEQHTNTCRCLRASEVCTCRLCNHLLERWQTLQRPAKAEAISG